VTPAPVTLSDGVVMLRPWAVSEASVMAEAARDRAIERYNGPPPESVADAVTVIEGFGQRWRDFTVSGDPTGVAFAIVDAATEKPVGMCGVDDWSATDVAQFGYCLAADARGQGLATRAARLMTGWLFRLGAARVFVTIVSENEPSAAVARRAGFTYEGTLRAYGVWQGRRQDMDVYAVLPHDWVESDAP
jgi:RimJ/RimL family protein N-acetyltransferase